MTVLTPPISRLYAAAQGAAARPPAAVGPRPPATRTVSHRPPPLAHVAPRRSQAAFQVQPLSPTCPSPAEDEEFAAARGGSRSPASGFSGGGGVRPPPPDFRAHGSLYHPTTPTTPVPQSFGAAASTAAASAARHPEGAAEKPEEPSVGGRETSPTACPHGAGGDERARPDREDCSGESRARTAQGAAAVAARPDGPARLAEPRSPVPSSARLPADDGARAETAGAAPGQPRPPSSLQEQHDIEQRSPQHPASDAQAGEGAAFMAQIFSFQKWKPMKQESIPKLCETQPLSLYFHADEQLMSAVKALSKVREGDSDKFHRCTERVHRAQKLLLDTIYLVYSGLDNDLKCPRDYRRHLPSEDQEELDDGFSENILFAAEALSRGFRIRGIERFTEQLLDPAKQLCAGFEALRFVFRSRALDLHRAGPAAAPAATQPPSQTSPPSRGPRFARRSATVPAAAHGALHPRHVPGGAAARRWHGPFASLYPVLIDFDKAWVVFEQKICFAYFAVTYSRHSDAAVPDTIPDTFPAVFPTPDDGTETFAALISEALGRAVKGNLIPQSRVQELHPSVMFAVPRLAVVAGLVHMPDRVDLTDNDCALWWLRDKAAALRELQRDLRSLSRGDLEALEMALAGRGSGEEDPEDAGPEQRAASAAAARADPGPDPDPDPAAAPPRTPSRPRQRQRPSAPAAGAAAAGTGGGDGGGEAAGAGRPGPGPRAAGEAEVPAAQRDGGPGPDRRRSRPVPSGPAEPAGAASPPAPDLRRLFTAVCNIADRLQSGPCAHEFSGVLEKAFRFHSS